MNNTANYIEVIEKYTSEELTQIGKTLNKSYNIYDPEEARWNQIKYALFRTSEDELNALKQKCFSNKFINDIILDYYICERVVKYYFIKSLLELSDHIVAFEMSIGGSRIDVCRINGTSYAYEIKTAYDTFERLKTQMSDYSKTFEKVYIIVPTHRVAEAAGHIPSNCGIIAYRLDNNSNMIFSYVKKSERNICDAEMCIESLSSSDMSYLTKLLKLKSSNMREEKMRVLKDYAKHSSIWTAYKNLLKRKYRERWNFLKTHINDILPIDVQNFFITTVEPALLYEHKGMYQTDSLL